MKTFTVRVEIGKSKKLTTITYPVEKFDYIKNNQIYIKGEEERMRISDDRIKNLLFQLNNEETKKLRDEFAMSALNGLVSRLYSSEDLNGWNRTNLVGESYAIADEMLKQR